MLLGPLSFRNCVHEPTTACQLVVDLLLEQEHILTGQRLEEAQRSLASQQTVEAGMAAAVILRAAEDALALGVDFLQHRSSTIATSFVT